MPGKHHPESFASRHRYPLVLAVVLLCIAVAGTLAAVQNRREPATPLMVMPALPALSATPSPVAAPASPSPSVAVSASPSRSASRAPAAGRSPSRRPSPSPTATKSPFTARYAIMNSRRSSFEAAI